MFFSCCFLYFEVNVGPWGEGYWRKWNNFPSGKQLLEVQTWDVNIQQKREASNVESSGGYEPQRLLNYFRHIIEMCCLDSPTKKDRSYIFFAFRYYKQINRTSCWQGWPVKKERYVENICCLRKIDDKCTLLNRDRYKDEVVVGQVGVGQVFVGQVGVGQVVVGQVGQLGEQLSVLRASYRQLAGLPEAPTKVGFHSLIWMKAQKRLMCWKQVEKIDSLRPSLFFAFWCGI